MILQRSFFLTTIKLLYSVIDPRQEINKVFTLSKEAL